jgi:DNA-directed RNA polymerase subunit RPC12/RpoP
MPVIDYKCENCGSGMVFDSQTGMLTCKSCGRQDNIQQMNDPIRQNVAFERETVEYHCKSCGAVLITEPATSATVCSFCGSAVVLADRLSGRKAPALVLPFAISKEEAMRAFRKWCKNGRLTPTGFMTANRVKSITGMYVPFWLYDLNNHVEAHGHGTRVRVYTQGDYQYTETKHYEVYRKMRLNYVGVPIDAAEKMNDELMDRLEPFPYQRLQTFKTPYLAGYLAEKYSYDEHQLLPRAKHKISPYIESSLRATVGSYTTMSFASKDIHTEMRRANYALLPVWVVHYDYNKKEHTFAMNGQTGKVVGKPPISKGKVVAWFAGIFGISLIGMKLISLAMGGDFL